MKNLLIILGNGFSIDFINQLEKSKIISPDTVDVKNLFRFGHRIKFPNDNRPGFLSFKRSPALWTLGARPNKTAEDASSLIEEIITCSNMLADYLRLPEKLQRRGRLRNEDPPMHIKAYIELIQYLKCLFADYNERISDQKIIEFIQNTQWGWVKLFDGIKAGKFNKVTIVTYNYDIWLERILSALKIKYNIQGIEKKQKAKIQIIKPHGSISFTSKQFYPPIHEIAYGNFKSYLDGADIKELTVGYKNMGCHSKNFLIPPAGDSSRMPSTDWAARLREKANKAAQCIEPQGEVVFCGMSYWHVDRKELDSLLINLDQDVHFSFVNPSPPKDLNAVLMSLFKNYTAYSSADLLGEVIND